MIKTLLKNYSSPLWVLRYADENVISTPHSKFSWMHDSTVIWEGSGVGVANLHPSFPTKRFPAAVFWCFLLILTVFVISLKFNFNFYCWQIFLFIVLLIAIQNWKPGGHVFHVSVNTQQAIPNALVCNHSLISLTFLFGDWDGWLPLGASPVVLIRWQLGLWLPDSSIGLDV